MNRDEIFRQLENHRRTLEELGIRSLLLFGSVARGDATPRSDVDLLVEFDQPIGLFQFARSRRVISEILGRPVDLVTREGLRPEFREDILREAVRAA